MTSPILTAELFRPLSRELLHLLRGLPPEAWGRTTTPRGWSVADVTAHLLDGDLRRISVDRDGHHGPAPEGPLEDFRDLVRHLDGLNETWVHAARRVSPALLIQLLEFSTAHVASVMEQADPHGPATFPVAWAGVHQEACWLDVGREYTERWHHQDQIRRTAGAPALDDPHFLRPALELSLLALPRVYSGVPSPAETRILLEVSGAFDACWSLTSSGDEERGWTVTSENPGPVKPACRIQADALCLTRLLLNTLSRPEVEVCLSVDGDHRLAQPLRGARALMV